MNPPRAPPPRKQEEAHAASHAHKENNRAEEEEAAHSSVPHVSSSVQSHPGPSRPPSSSSSLCPVKSASAPFVSPQRLGALTALAGSKTAASADVPTRYFHVTFCPRSTKKNKHYDDGILLVQGRRCVLKSMENEQKSSSLSSEPASKFVEGSRTSNETHQMMRNRREDSRDPAR